MKNVLVVAEVVDIAGERYILGLTHDITAKKRAEEDRENLKTQLLQSQKMDAVGQLAGGIAHDFNNILTAIMGYGHILKMKMKYDDPLRIYPDRMLEAAERAANLTQSLLAFSRKQIIKPRPVDVNGIIGQVDRIFLSTIKEDIEFRTVLAPDDLIVMVDPGQIEQALVNLVVNAVDAMREGGTLTITTGLATFDNKFIKSRGYGKPGKYARISVTDTGIGIGKEIRKKIFEPFFTTKEVGKGTGLGLSMVHGIIKEHDGYIDVRSERGKGATFEIYIPLSEEGIGEIQYVEPPSFDQGTETILLAEDEKNVRSYIKQFLEDFGYKVIEAVDGKDAVNRFMSTKDRIDLLLFDVIMPKKNSKEAYDLIKKQSPDSKILFMSGYAADVIHQKGFVEREIDFILKPVSPIELLKKIREVLK